MTLGDMAAAHAPREAVSHAGNSKVPSYIVEANYDAIPRRSSNSKRDPGEITSVAVESTIVTHVASITKKTGVANRIERIAGAATGTYAAGAIIREAKASEIGRRIYYSERHYARILSSDSNSSTYIACESGSVGKNSSRARIARVTHVYGKRGSKRKSRARRRLISGIGSIASEWVAYHEAPVRNPASRNSRTYKAIHTASIRR